MSTAELRTSAAETSPAVRHTGTRARVYVSSAAEDLRDARAIVIDTIRRCGYEPVAMESYGADGRRPIERCLQDVESSDVYVGVVAWRYGSCPPGDVKSFTHLEYETAVGLRKQILLFHLDEKAAWPTAHVDQSQRAVRRFRELQARDHVVDTFGTLEQLANGVRQALLRLFGGATVSVPALLPYIVDRHAQKESLAARGRELDRSPSLIVVHGAADQVHHKFVEYMHERLLTRYLGVGQVHPISVALRPDELDQPAVITRRVADSCGLDPTLDVDALSRRLHDFGSLTMLRFPVKVDVRRGRPDTRGVGSLVSYFDRWPQYRPLRVLPVISAQYVDTPGWSSVLRRPRTARGGDFAHAIERTAAATGSCTVVVLPELVNVEQVEVEVWAQQDEVRRFLGDADPMPEIRRIFRTHERSSKETGVSMEVLAEELTRLLHRLSPRPGEG